MSNPSEKKAERLIEIESLLYVHKEGLHPAEIARRLGVNRSTVGRYYPALPKHIYLESDGRWKLDRSAALVNVRFNLHEALAVHLAARLLAARMDRLNPHAAAALRKLGMSMEKLAPQISHHVQQSADVMDDAAQRRDFQYLQVLEAMTSGWAEGRKLRIWYRRGPDQEVVSYIYAVYFIEPNAIGQSTYAIGRREPPGEIRTHKIERIERAELLDETYAIPVTFDPSTLLADAWGIWYSENEPETVKLRFHARVAARVRESRWHRSELVEDLPDGYLLWTARVAEPREMMPWVRGWGADVEVLEPSSLRQAILEQVNGLYSLYHLRDGENISTE